jgi:hypothetical protein
MNGKLHFRAKGDAVLARADGVGGEAGEAQRRKPRRGTAACAGMRSLRKPLFRDLVVSVSKKLDKTESVAKRIRHQCQLSPLSGGDGRLEQPPGIQRLLNSRFDIFDDKVKMDRCPMSFVTAEFSICAYRTGSGFLNKKIYRRTTTQHLDGICTEATSNRQSEDISIKANCLIEIIDVNVH